MAVDSEAAGNVATNAVAGVERPQPLGSPSDMPLILRVPDFLSWNEDTNILKVVRRKYLQMLDGAFNIWLSDPKFDDFRRHYELLAPAEQQRVLAAPKVAHGLLHQSSLEEDNLRRCVDEVLSLESCNSEEGRDEFGPAWQLSSGESYCRSVQTLAKLSAYTDGELGYVLERLDRSVRNIQAISWPASEMIAQVLRVVVGRKDLEDPRGFSSSSWPGWVGLIAVTNGHRRDLDEAWIADSLVHESIHSFLYMVEGFEPFYASIEASRGRLTESPWSGKMLYLHSYVHACFVWFGLLSFWNQARASELFTTPTAEFFRQRARSGFGADTLERLGTGINDISNPVRQAITAMQQIVIAS
jgi:hypothetical protein